MSIGKDFFELTKKIGYEFKDISYLENALTHASYANEQRAKGSSYPSNERLEFLGGALIPPMKGLSSLEMPFLK